MQIASLTAGAAGTAFSALGTLGPATSALTNSAIAVARPVEPTPGAGGNDALRQVLASYDLRHISPSEFSQMVQELGASGAITDSERQELSQIASQLAAAGFDAGEPLDLVAMLQQRLAELAQQDAEQGGEDAHAAALAEAARLIERQLDWVEKLDAIDRGADVAGVNVVV